MDGELELQEPACDVRGTPAGDNNRPGWTHKLLIVAACQHTAVIHIFCVNSVSIGQTLHAFNGL